MTDLDIAGVIAILETAERRGENEDTPEGVRTITLSDTLAIAMATALKRYIDERGL